MTQKLKIIGAGGHGKVVLDAVLKSKTFQILGFCVDDLVSGEVVFSKYSIIDDAHLSNSTFDNSIYFIAAIGDNNKRKELYENAIKKHFPTTIIHPNSIISSDVTIGKGTIIMAGAIINAGSSIGENCIINSGVVIDHDCVVGSHSHLRIGTILSSNTKIESLTCSNIGQVF